MKTKIINAKETIVSNNNSKKKQQIVEKIATFLKNKFSKLFNEKNYNLKQITFDLNSLITENDLKNFDYQTAILRIEKTILEKVSKMESKEVKGILDMNKINELIKPIIKQDPPSNRNNNQNSNRNANKAALMTKSKSMDVLAPVVEGIHKEKVQILKIKEEDEWALIAKHNYEKFINEQKNKKQKEEDLKQIQKDFLESQIREKEIMKKKLKDEERQFYNQHSENIKKMQEQEKQKELQSKEKMRVQKEIQNSMISESKKNKEEKKIKEKVEDNKILAKIQNDISIQEQKQIQKKLQDKEVYKKIIEENEVKCLMKKVGQEKEREDNKRAQEEYSKLIEKQERDRSKSLTKKIEKMNYLGNSFNLNVAKRDEVIKQYEAQKLQKEILEKEEA
jgi:hypothetical protein